MTRCLTLSIRLTQFGSSLAAYLIHLANSQIRMRRILKCRAHSCKATLKVAVDSSLSRAGAKTKNGVGKETKEARVTPIRVWMLVLKWSDKAKKGLSSAIVKLQFKSNLAHSHNQIWRRKLFRSSERKKTKSTKITLLKRQLQKSWTRLGSWGMIVATYLVSPAWRS